MGRELPKLLHSTGPNPAHLFAIGGLGHRTGDNKLCGHRLGFPQYLDAADPACGGLDPLGESEGTCILYFKNSINQYANKKIA